MAADVALAAARVTGKEAAAIVYRSDAAAQRALGERFHLVHHLHQKEQLSVGAAWRGVGLLLFAPVVFQRHDETGVDHLLALFDIFHIARPRFAIGRIGEHEVERLPGKFVGRQRRTVADIFGVVPLDHHIRFADGVGFVVDLLAVEIDIALGANLPFGIFDELLRLGEHSATSAGGVVNLHHRRQTLFDGVEEQMGHQLDHLAGRKMLARLFVVLFVETADQLFEDIAHPQIAQRRELAPFGVDLLFVGEVDIGGSELFEHLQQYIFFRHVPYLRTKLELFDDLLHIGAEAVEIVHEVGFEKLAGVGSRIVEALKRPFARIVKDITARVAQSVGIELCQTHLFTLETQLFEYLLFALFQQRIEPPQYHHRQDDITVLAPHIDIAQAVVGDRPDEVDESVVDGLIHIPFSLSIALTPVPL